MKHLEDAITDHALVRYLERVKGIPLDDVRQEMRDLCWRYVDSGAVQAQIDGFWWQFRAGRVVTILPRKASPDFLLGKRLCSTSRG
jgi:hypothetical protein